MWDQKYGQTQYFYGTEPNDFLKQQASQIPENSRILCLADGEGRNSVYLATLGHRVTGMDSSSVGLGKARNLAILNRVKIESLHADLNEYVITPNSWDAIILIFCHMPSSLRNRIHQACVKGLKADGLLILEAYTPRQLGRGTGGPKNIDLLMEPQDLKQDFEPLHFLHFAEAEREVHEGIGHTGLASVIQILARRESS